MVTLPPKVDAVLAMLERESRSGSVTLNIANGRIVGFELLLRERLEKA